MTSNYKTEQEGFWAGQFGDDYVKRNQGAAIVAGNLALFARVLARTVGVRSVLEFGANIGLNLAALRTLVPGVALSAIEINASAVADLRRQGDITVHAQSILEFAPACHHDLVLIKGVLIHMNPDCVNQVYDLLEMLDRFGDLRLLDYGFRYHRDSNFPQDDITWFLLEKSGTQGAQP